jgi:hypothetical protein
VGGIQLAKELYPAFTGSGRHLADAFVTEPEVDVVKRGGKV